MGSSETVKIERMSYGPDAIAHRADGKTLFVSGGVPGETVSIRVVEEKPSFAHAKIEAIETPSPDRVQPASPEDEACGTAPWQHLSYEAQLQAKRDHVVGALTHTAHFDRDRAERVVGACIGSKRQWGYRNKIELAATVDAGGRFEVGFHREGTDEIVPSLRTRLAHKQIERAPKALRGAIRYAQGASELGIYRIGVRHSLATGELEVACWTRPGPFPRAVFATTLSAALKATSVVRVLAEPGKARKIKGVEVLDGRGYWRERIGQMEFSTAAPSFFQVNTVQAERLVSLVLEGLGDIDGKFVADLYAGGGTFSIPLALAGAEVTAIESAGSSVRDLRFNADLNEVYVDVLGGDSARELAELGQLDALVVDPPRAGLAREVPGLIADASPERMAYVSCDPQTWARDVARLEEVGYRLERAVPVDMFPQTYHVETASFFVRE